MAAVSDSLPSFAIMRQLDEGPPEECAEGLDVNVVRDNVVKIFKTPPGTHESVRITAKTKALAKELFQQLDAIPEISTHIQNLALVKRKIYLIPPGNEVTLTNPFKEQVKKAVAEFQTVHGPESAIVAFTAYTSSCDKLVNCEGWDLQIKRPAVRKLVLEALQTSEYFSKRILPPEYSTNGLLITPNGIRTRFTKQDEEVLFKLVQSIPVPVS